MTSIDLNKFDPKKLRNKNNNCIIIGKRGVGKTNLVHDLLYYNDLYRGITICETIPHSYHYKQIMRESNIFDGYNENIIEKIMKKQSNLIQSNGVLNFGLNCRDISIFLVLDDIIYGNRIHDEYLKKLFNNNRCYCISNYITIQYPLLCPTMRCNADYIFFFNGYAESVKKNFYDKYIQPRNLFDDYKIFSKIYDELPKDYILVVDNTVYNNNKIHDNIYWYKIEEHIGYHVYDKLDATVIFQKYWRRILAKRQLQRLKIKDELEYLPHIGIKYFDAEKHWNNNIFIQDKILKIMDHSQV